MQINPDHIPRRGYIGKREVAAIFGCSWATIERRLKAGTMTLPKPMCKRAPEGVFGATTPLKWPAEEIWAAYRESWKGARA